MLPALDNSIGCAISSVAGAGLHYWMSRFKCLLIVNSAGANSNLPTPIACAAYSVYEKKATRKCHHCETAPLIPPTASTGRTLKKLTK
jgi:hypothetical protein